MARIYPFRALRYNPAKVNLEDVVTQPYDKISPEMQQAYYDRSPYNLIRVILGKKNPSDTEAENVYTRAAATLSGWRKENILAEESEPAIFGYSQTYLVPGTTETRERRGFIALGHLYDYADQIVYRHEQTFPKHKSDRLALFKATRAYCEQIYMLYSDPAFTAEKLIFDSNTAPDLSVTDEYNVVHKVWKVTDPTLINLLTTAMQDKKLIIADGHHRYETSVAYMHERAATLGIPSNESPSNAADEPQKDPLIPAFPEAAMMMTFVNMEAPGITILPTHRVVFGLKDFSVPAFIEKVKQFFDVETIVLPTEEDAPHLANVLLNKLTGTHGTVIAVATQHGNFLLHAKPQAVNAALTRFPERQRQLDVTQLHAILLEDILQLSHESIAKLENIRYIREAAESVEQVASKQADLAFLIKPVTLTQLKDIALNLEVMPQKSTDFYPKLLSGLAIYALD